MADGCVIEAADLQRCVIGVRSHINRGARLDNVVMMGQDEFGSPDEHTRNRAAGRPDMGIGAGTTIHRAIIDKNARIGNGVHLSPNGLPNGWGAGRRGRA